MEEKIGVELKNVFGSTYTVYALPRNHIEELIRHINIVEMVQMAYGAYSPQFADGEAQIDVTTGEVIGYSRIESKHQLLPAEIRRAHYVTLYRIPQDQEWSYDDILGEREWELGAFFDEEPTLTIKEFCAKKGIDYYKRGLYAAIEDAYQQLTTQEWKERIDIQITQIYSQEEAEG